MANTYGIKLVMTADNTDAIAKARQVKEEMSYLQDGNIGSPIMESNVSPDVRADKVDSTSVLPAVSQHEVNKGILEELKALTSYITGNTSDSRRSDSNYLDSGRFGNNSDTAITEYRESPPDRNENGSEDSERSSFLEPVTTESVFKDMLQELKVLSNHFIRGNGNPNFINPAQNNGQKTSKTKEDGRIKTLAATAAFGIESGLIAYNTGNARVRMAEWRGDYFGSQIARNNRTANAITTGTSVIPLVSAVVGAALPGIGPMIGVTVGEAIKKGIDTFVGSRNENKNVKIEEKQLQSDTYKGRLRLNEESLAMYGRNIENNSAKQNANYAMQMQSYFNTQSKNTGMELDEFQDLANSYSRYGVEDYETAGNLARTTALTQSYTGADATEFLGTQTRLGKDTGKAADAMNFAFGASLSSGLSKGQFGEFLNGLQRAVEDGISNGFIQSTDEVSKTMVMFSKLSGENPAWQGQYGFQKLNQMNQGLRSATSLENTSQILAFQSLRGMNDGTLGVERIEGEDALNTFALMERGFTPKTFKAISERFSNQYGDDTMENILAWKQLTGLNYTGAMQLYKMQMEKNGNVTDDDIQSVMASPEYNTDQKNMVNYLNDIKSNTSILGEGSFRKYLEGLAGIDDKYKSASKTEKESLDMSNGFVRDFNTNVIESINAYKSRGGLEVMKDYAILLEGMKNEKGRHLIKESLSSMNSDERARQNMNGDGTMESNLVYVMKELVATLRGMEIEVK